MRPTAMTLTVLVATCIGAAGCGAGPYGFSRYYEPLKAEEAYHEQSNVFTYSAVTARPQDYVGRLIGWFGVVEKVEAAPDGRHLVRLTFHAHKERHLCETEVSSSCRVTVNFKSTGTFSIWLALRGPDLIPSLDKVQPGTLMRVFGKVRCVKAADGTDRCERDEQGGVLLDGVYYRQWPARFYRTTRAAGDMRR